MLPYLYFQGNYFLKIIFIKMNKSDLDSDWEIQKAKLKQRFANLTDNDLLYFDEKKDEMLEKLQVKLGKTKEELIKILDKI